MTIGTLASSASGSLSIGVAVSGATPAGAGYRVRVVASDPITIGTDNATDIAINALPTVTQTAFSALCIDNGAITLSGGLPAGGTYSGSGVVAGSFDPSISGPGTHSITYYYIDGNGCDGSAVETIDVNDLPVVTQSAFANVCLAEAAFALSGGTPAGGTYSGTGVSGGMFDPGIAGLGTHFITYMFTDSIGCTSQSTQSILVDACASIQELEANTILLYPNPTETTFTLDTDATIQEVLILDMNGRMVFRFAAQTDYDISSLTDGVYLVRIKTNDQQIVKRLIVR